MSNRFALAIIREFEGCRLKAYRDPAGIWTIGWGHTSAAGGLKVTPGLQITQAQADAILAEDVAIVEAQVRSLVKVPVTDQQFGALVSFAYNLGADIDADALAEGLGDSTLLKRLNAGDYAGAAGEFHKWDHAGGVKLNGLTRRRAAERALFLGVDLPAPVPADPFAADPALTARIALLLMLLGLAVVAAIIFSQL